MLEAVHVGRGRGSLEAILVAELILLAHVDTWIEYGKCTSNGNEEKGRIVCAAEQDKGAIWLFTRRAGPDYYGWRLHTWLASCVEVEVHPRRGIGIPFVGQVDGRCLNVSISYLKAFQISHSVAIRGPLIIHPCKKTFMQEYNCEHTLQFTAEDYRVHSPSGGTQGQRHPCNRHSWPKNHRRGRSQFGPHTGGP